MKKLLLIIIFFSIGKFAFGQCGCTNCPEPLPDNTNQNFYVNVSDNNLDSVDDCSTMLLESINLHFDHEYISDLIVTITSPCGNSIVLMGNIGFYGATDGTVWDINFEDGPVTPDPGFSPAFDTSEPWGLNGNFTGTYNPFIGTLASLNCPDNCGDWIINVSDAQENDLGNFLDFSLDFGSPSSTGQLTCHSEVPPICPDCSNLLGPFTNCYDSNESDLVFLEICPPPGQIIDVATILAGTFEAGFDNLTIYSGPTGSGISGIMVLPPTDGNLENTAVYPVDSLDCLIFVSNSDGSISCSEGIQNEMQIVACTSCNSNITGNQTDIPTLSQWGLIFLAILLMNFGSVTMLNESLSYSTIGLFVFKNKSINIPFHKKTFSLSTIITSLLIIFGFTFCYLIYGTIFKPDIIGTALTAPIFTYLLHLLLWMEFEK